MQIYFISIICGNLRYPRHPRSALGKSSAFVVAKSKPLAYKFAKQSFASNRTKRKTLRPALRRNTFIKLCASVSLCLKLFIISQLFFLFPVQSQQPIDVRSSVIIIQSLRYMQNTPDASDIVKETIARKHINNYASQPFAAYNYYKKTSVDVVADGKTILLYEDYGTIYQDHLKNRKTNQIHASRNVGFFETTGHQNIANFLDEALGEIDLYKNETELMLLKFKSPLADDALKTYQYNLLGLKRIDGNDCYEIAFFAKNLKDNAFAGYLYIDASNTFALRKAVFTLNDPAGMNLLKNVLFTHSYTNVQEVMCPVKKEIAIALGDETQGGFSITRSLLYSGFNFGEIEKKSWKTEYDPDFRNRDNNYWQSIRPVPLTPSQSQIDELVKIASGNSTYAGMEKLFNILLTNYVTAGGVNGKVELGPILQFLSYNDMEGIRMRIGGNTTTAFMNQLQVGGYVAYGLDDDKLKYRGNLIYSFLPRDKYIWEYPKKLLSFTYVNDLNIPGQDLLKTNRDNILYSFSHTATKNMSLQKIGLLTFENENKRNFSYTIGAKYTSDSPAGVVKYMKVSGMDTTIINRLNTAELTISLRYSPNERFFQIRDKRIPIRRGDVEWILEHRIGIKGIVGSDYNYQITNAKAYKRFNLGSNTGSLDTRLSAGIVWNKVPFPLLFIPEGNQSYAYQTENFNSMNFYEFITDRFVAGNVNFLFNWSPVKWMNNQSKIKTSLGARTIYGPLSDKNNPAFHSDLFIFNQGVTPLGSTPYVEMNAGLVNVFKFLRIEYVHRLTYINGGHRGNRGSLLISGSFSL